MMNLIQTALLYYAVISVVESVIGFNQRCPGQNEWHFRRKNCTTPDKPFYTCLYNEYSLQYSENCTRQEYESRKGKKVVFSPGISETDCADSRFQPFKFTTHGFSVCIYAKSTCSEDGQVLVKNGTTFVDRSCRCDYRKGYDYITQPKEKCFCEPSLEDCSCYLTNCTGNSALTQDYECVLKVDSRSGSNVCGEILDG
ncbi:unnamed protein product [Mytilus coruscus]|uniref:Uncharacterized protein n=1 Tax=Mytilus coruscus TaxID=42192 RepID=A0A6J8EY02_MYTCO|nr:unnamed protein product [Mytilus coruscus]